MDAVLQGREIGAADQIGLGRHGVDEIVGQRQLRFGEIVEDVMMDQGLLAGMADAEPDAVEGRTDMSLDRAQAIVPGVTALALDADLAQGQIELVMEDDDVVRRDVKKRAASPTARPESFI